MKNTTLLFMAIFVYHAMAFTAPISCTPITKTVTNLSNLNAELDYLENNSGNKSTTIIIKDGTYNSTTAPALNRYISPTGGCPCTIKAETPYKVNLRGKVFWRLHNSKNLTITGINFIRTTTVSGKPPVVDFSGGSDNKIMNGIFVESFSSVPSGNNYYIQFYEGDNNVVENIVFKHKYSNGHYLNMDGSQNNQVINSTFKEVSQIAKPKNFYINAVESDDNLIKDCTFSNKISEGDYIYLGGGANNAIDSNSFSESSWMQQNMYLKYYVDLHLGDRQIVKNNSFSNKLSKGQFIDVSDYEIDENKNHHQILDNYFGSMHLRENFSVIKVGHCGGQTTAEVNAGILIEGNTFENYNYNGHGYDEIISNKSSGNSYLNNTFKNCKGYLKLRCGDGATVVGNRFVGSNQPNEGGLYVIGPNHKIYNNHFENLGGYPLILLAGNEKESFEPFNYKPVDNLTFSFNTIVDSKYNIYFNKQSSNWIMPRDVKIDNNIIVTNMGNNSISTTEFVRIDPDFLPSTADIMNWNTNIFKRNIFYSDNTIPLVTSGYVLNSENPYENYVEQDPDIVRSLETYIPKIGSIAIGNAYTLNYGYITEDIFQQSRDSSPDIGCYERTSSNLFTRINSNEESSDLTTIQLYPNPVGQWFTLNLGETVSNVNVSIQNIYGKTLIQRNYPELRNTTLDLEGYPEGMYFITIDCSKYSKTLKILKKE